MATISDSSQTLLVQTLASFETPWLPLRRDDWGRAGAICARRRGERGFRDPRFLRRAQVAAMRSELREAGLLSADHQLTVAGRRLARSLSWPFSRDELSEAVRRLVAAAAAGDCMDHAGVRLVPEQLIAGAWWGVPVILSARLFLPLLADGAIASRSAPDGRVFYHVVGADIAAAARTITDPDIPFRDSEAFICDAEAQRCREVMLSDNDFYHDLGDVPVASKPLASGRRHDDLAGIEPLFADCND